MIKFYVKTLSIGLSACLIGLPSSIAHPSDMVKSRYLVGEKTIALTVTANDCLTIYKKLEAESTDAGGNFGLVNTKTSITTAWTSLQSASDAKFDGTTVTDGVANFYVKYKESSAPELDKKGYITIGTISLSKGPQAVRKIRFTKA